MTTTNANLTSTQFCSHTFDVLKAGEKTGLYIYRVEIGGGDWAYSVKRGEAGGGVKGSTIKANLDSRKEAMAWVEKSL